MSVPQNGQKSDFFVSRMLMREALRDSSINDPREKLVLIAIADHANASGYSRPGHRRLADQAGVTERQVRRIIDRLQSGGKLQRVAGHGPGKPQGYQLPTADIQASAVQNQTPDISTPNSGHPQPNSGHLEAEQRTFGDGAYKEGRVEGFEGLKNRPQPKEPEGSDLWLSTKTDLRKHLATEVIDAWFDKVRFLGIDGDTCLLGADEITADWIADYHLTPLKASLERAGLPKAIKWRLEK